MQKFETQIQYWKHQCLKEVAKSRFSDTLIEDCLTIPKKIIPGKTPTARCCVYKERAILGQRVQLAMGGDKNNPNVIEVLDIACDECPAAGYTVSDGCRGCLAHKCANACRKNAISFDHNRTAHINKTLCVECGLCAKACPYGAITSRQRPCQNACSLKAISINPDMSACINNDKCVSCGACAAQCPFGAISDKSFIMDAVDLIKKRMKDENMHLYALIAPAIATQFDNCKLSQVITALKQLHFDEVVEVALGADMVAQDEAKELSEKGFLFSSCCPSFVKFIEKNYPELKELISDNLSPMAALGKYIKEHQPNAYTVFIGPCMSKKAEAQKENVKKYIDCVLTFEELVALFDSRDIDPEKSEETPIDNASFFGRMFAKSGGVINAVNEVIKEQNLNMEVKPESADGMDAIKLAVLRKSKNLTDCNFIEGMACRGGCINGPACIFHKDPSIKKLENFSKESSNKDIKTAVNNYQER